MDIRQKRSLLFCRKILRGFRVNGLEIQFFGRRSVNAGLGTHLVPLCDKIVDITILLGCDDGFTAHHKACISGIIDYGPFPHLIDRDRTGSQIHQYADRQIDKDDSKNKDTDIKMSFFTINGNICQFLFLTHISCPLSEFQSRPSKIMKTSPLELSLGTHPLLQFFPQLPPACPPVAEHDLVFRRPAKKAFHRDRRIKMF